MNRIPPLPFPANPYAPETLIAARLVASCSRVPGRMMERGSIGQVPIETGVRFALEAKLNKGLRRHFPKDDIRARLSALDLYGLGPSLNTLKEIARVANVDNPFFWLDPPPVLSAQRTWLVNPHDDPKISGEAGAISVALMEAGALVCTVMGLPDLCLPQFPGRKGCLLVTAQGEGSWVAPLGDSSPFEPLQDAPFEQGLVLRLAACHVFTDPKPQSSIPRGLIQVAPESINLRPPYLAIFDLHGTLLEPNWKQGLQAVYRHLCAGETDQQVWDWVEENTYGQIDTEIFDRLTRLRRGLTRETVEELYMVLMTAGGETKSPNIIPGVDDFLGWLSSRDIPIVIPTFARVGRKIVIRQLAHSGLTNFIEPKNVMTRDDVPDIDDKAEFRRECIRHIAHKWHRHGGTLLFFNDTPDGMDAVTELSGVNVGILHGRGLDLERRRREHISAGAHLLIHGWQEAVPDLKKLLS